MSEIEAVYRESVRERDLDNFFVEEINAPREIRAFILLRFAGVFTAPDEGEARVRETPPPETGDGRQCPAGALAHAA